MSFIIKSTDVGDLQHCIRGWRGNLLRAEVVVAQVVDRWYSVRASQVRVPGWTLGSFQFRVVVDLISLSVWAFSDQQGQRTSLFFPFSFNQHCHNFFFNCDEKIRKINPKKRPLWPF